MKTHKNRGKPGVTIILITLLMLFSTLLTVLPVSQHTEAATAEEMLNEAKTVYPTLNNPSFETGDITGWNNPAGGKVVSIVYGSTPDGDCYATIGGIWSGFDVYSGLVLKNQDFKTYIRRCHATDQPSSNYYWAGDGYCPFLGIKIYGYDVGKNFVATKYYDFRADNYPCVYDTWVLLERNLKTDFGNTTWDAIKYVSIHFMLYGGDVYDYFDFDGIYLGDYHNTTNMFTINSADTTTVQSQNECISFWAVNSYGSSVNDVKISVENYPLKSLSVDCVGITGNSIGYCGVGAPHYISLGIESPSSVGLYDVNLLFIYYNTYNEEIGRERFTITVSNIAIQISTLFDKDTYELGQTSSLTMKNNMDRTVKIYIFAWYESSMFLYGDTAHTLSTGDIQTLTLRLLDEGKYTFEFRIYYEEVLQNRELRVSKQINIVPAKITSKYNTNIYSVTGDSTLDYSFYTNSTELSDYTIYVRTTYPDSTTGVVSKTVYNGLYEWYSPIPTPAVNYSSDTFKVEVFRQISTVSDIQYGTGEYLSSGGAYDDGLLVWEHTYTIHEEPITPTGWGGDFGDITMYLIIALLVGVGVISLMGYAKAFKKTGGKR